MTPKEIYDLTPIRVTNGIYLLEKHFSDVDFFSIEQENGPIQARYYADHSFDGERCWELFSLWIDDKPFMICQEAGRGGRDHIDNFITNKDLYLKACDELRKLYKKEVPVFDETENLVDLTDFYGKKLEFFYSKNVSQKYKVGDIVEIMEYEVPNGYDPNRPKLRVRARIDKINKFSPYETYSGTQIDRKYDYNLRQYVTDVDNGSIGCYFCDEDVL